MESTLDYDTITKDEGMRSLRGLWNKAGSYEDTRLENGSQG